MEGKKVALELNIVSDGREFLNFWDSRHGNDVACQIKEGKLIWQDYDVYNAKFKEKEITLSEFISLVKDASKA